MNTKSILHWNPGYGEFNLIEEDRIITIPYEFNNLINYSINSCTFESKDGSVNFLFPFIIKDWKIENLINNQTKRIQITFNKLEDNIIHLKIENYLKRISLKNKLDSQIKVYDWNEKSIDRFINISEQAIVKIPSEFTCIKECNINYLIMTHYKSPINYLIIKWKVPITNINQKIIQKKGFNLKTNFNIGKRIILNKTIIKGIEINIKLTNNSFDLVDNPFTKLVRNIIYKPILN